MPHSETAACLLLLAAGVASGQQTSGSTAAQAHIDAARRLAGTDVTAPFEFFCVPGNARPNSFSAPPLEPVRLFDNLYAAGNSETVVYALTTSEGIVLIDSGTAAEVESVLIPGRTSGLLAFIFSVYDNGTRHVAGMFGSTVLAAQYTPPPGLRQYIESLAHYREIAARMGVDVEIQNHPIFDATPERLAALAARGPSDPHPFVMGTDRCLRFRGVISECMQADILRRDSR